jgi:hypothetical protein
VVDDAGTPRKQSLQDWIRLGLETRCKLALCFTSKNGVIWGIEALAELPVGLTVAAARHSSFAQFLNERPATVSLKGGIRFILPNDWVSIAVYMSTRDITGYRPVRLRGSRFEYDPSSIRRPYPGAALGLFGDLLWLGVDIEELRNLGEAQNPAFPAGATVARVATFTLAIPIYAALHQTIAAARAKREAEKKAEAQKP